jgi:hypothetical protein
MNVRPAPPSVEIPLARRNRCAHNEGMTPCVLLRHDEPDGGWHFDWLMARWDPQREGGDSGPLICFRVQVRPDEDGVEVFEGHRLADHRSAYLSHEGEISGGRGSVRRVARGWCIIDEEQPDRLVVHVEFGGQPRRLIGTRKPHQRRPAPLGDWEFKLG